MVSNNYTLTKTKILSGLQCHKKLWFDLHDPKKKEHNWILEKGFRFENIVRENYSKNYGKVLDLSGDWEDVVSKTMLGIKSNDIEVIFEGAFIYLDTLVRADVLIKNKKGWELLEIKSSTKLKDAHISDIAIQSFIVKKCGVNLTSVKLIHVNEDFTYTSDGNYKDLINFENEITDEVALKEKDVSNYIRDLTPLIDEKDSPNILMGDHCQKPYLCDYQVRCKSSLTETNITSYDILPFIGKNKKVIEYCKENGIEDLQKFPAKFFKDHKNYAPGYHKIIQDAHKNNKSWFSSDLKDIFSELEFPFFFMDFETVQQGVPIIKGTQPNYALPFQWSVHKLESIDKKIELNDAKSFLKFNDQNIEREFVEELLKAVGSKGVIFVHSPYEVTTLNKMKIKDSCKDLTDKIDNLIARIKDTLPIVRKNFYSPLMNGSYSIKDIIRATTPSDINYDDKDGISSGDAAQLAWFIYTDPKTSEKDKELQRKLLIEYCSKDTLVLYYLVKHLMDSYV
jgi:hypothetical protein